eukprot:SAG31_NODE_60_length_29419_cov_39.876398_29_plen_30_part_00
MDPAVYPSEDFVVGYIAARHGPFAHDGDV